MEDKEAERAIQNILSSSLGYIENILITSSQKLSQGRVLLLIDYSFIVVLPTRMAAEKQ